MEKTTKNTIPTNWHVIEEGQMRSAWNTYEVAKEFYDRLTSAFPDVTFELLQLDTLEGSGLRDETGAFYD